MNSIKGLFVTHSGYLQLFYLLERALKREMSFVAEGYYVSGRENYERFLSSVDEHWRERRSVVCEWEILEEAAQNKEVSLEKLTEWENWCGDPTLWNVLISDRRIIYGRRCVFTQDYTPRFSHDEMLRILLTALAKIRQHVERVRPDFILSFINVSFGEYLYYLMARRLRIPFLNLRNTKIENYMTAAPDIFEPSRNVQDRYREFQKSGTPKELREFSEAFVSRFKKSRVTYEGQTYLDPSNASRLALRRIGGSVRSLVTFGCQAAIGCLRGNTTQDNQVPNPLIATLYQDWIKPARFWIIRRRFRNSFIALDDLTNVPFIFYPLHLEPEISLLTYSRPYLNQIEVIRTFAMSLPVGWKLIVKEHPKNPYYHTIRYFRKLFEIPNLYMLPHTASTFEAIRKSRGVLTISGFVGFEALAQGKPAMGVGGAAYECLPRSMYRKVTDLRNLGSELFDLLRNHKQDDEALIRFVASVVRESVRFDWYTIGKGIRRPARGNLDEFLNQSPYQEQFAGLARYIAGKVGGAQSVSSRAEQNS